MVEVEIKEKLRDFDTVRDNMAKLGVWLEDKGVKLEGEKKVLREKYGYKKFVIYLDEFENAEKLILIKKALNSENPVEQNRAMGECTDLLNFLMAVSQA